MMVHIIQFGAFNFAQFSHSISFYLFFKFLNFWSFTKSNLIFSIFYLIYEISFHFIFFFQLSSKCQLSNKKPSKLSNTVRITCEIPLWSIWMNWSHTKSPMSDSNDDMPFQVLNILSLLLLSNRRFKYDFRQIKYMYLWLRSICHGNYYLTQMHSIETWSYRPERHSGATFI